MKVYGDCGSWHSNHIAMIGDKWVTWQSTEAKNECWLSSIPRNHAKSYEPLRYGIMVLLHNLLEASYQFPARHWPISKSHGTCTSHTERAAGYHCLHIATQHPVQRRWWKGITVSEIICEELMSMELRTTHWTLWFSEAFASFGHAWPWIQTGLSLTWKTSTHGCE